MWLNRDSQRKYRSYGLNEEEKDRFRVVIATNADELEGYGRREQHCANSNFVYLKFEMPERQPDEAFINAVATEMVRMIRHYHPKLMKEPASGE